MSDHGFVATVGMLPEFNWVEAWALKIKSALGLNKWHIHLRFVTQPDIDGDDTDGKCHAQAEYFAATLTFKIGCLIGFDPDDEDDDDRNYAYRLVLHEMVHVLLADIGEAAEVAVNLSVRGSSLRKRVFHALNRAEERTVVDLTYALYPILMAWSPDDGEAAAAEERPDAPSDGATGGGDGGLV